MFATGVSHNNDTMTSKESRIILKSRSITHKDKYVCINNNNILVFIKNVLLCGCTDDTS